MDEAQIDPKAKQIHDQQNDVEDYNGDGPSHNDKDKAKHHCDRVRHKERKNAFSERVNLASEIKPISWLEIIETAKCELFSGFVFILSNSVLFTLGEVAFALVECHF